MASATWSSNPWVWVVSFKRLVPGEWEAGPRERPILFRGEMVRAILEGRKTQARRVVGARDLEVLKFYWGTEDEPGGDAEVAGQSLSETTGKLHVWNTDYPDEGSEELSTPYGKPGDRLWVRETWGLHAYGDETDWHSGSLGDLTSEDIRALLERWELANRADWGTNQEPCFWRPSIHMPRWACRLVLEVTGVRVERLQDISEEDARAEGVEHVPFSAIGEASGFGPRMRTTAAQAFADLWESLHG